MAITGLRHNEGQYYFNKTIRRCVMFKKLLINTLLVLCLCFPSYATTASLRHNDVGEILTQPEYDADAYGEVGVHEGNASGASIIVASSTSPNKEKASYVDGVQLVCDGVEDDYQIQLALNAVSQNGGLVELLEGTYYITDKYDYNMAVDPGDTLGVEIYDNTILKGQGSSNTFIVPGEDGMLSLVQNRNYGTSSENFGIVLKDLTVSSFYKKISGLDNAGTANKLTDSVSGDFINAGIRAGDQAWNKTDQCMTIITAVDSATVLSVNDGGDTCAFGNTDQYEISVAYRAAAGSGIYPGLVYFDNAYGSGGDEEKNSYRIEGCSFYGLNAQDMIMQGVTNAEVTNNYFSSAQDIHLICTAAYTPYSCCTSGASAKADCAYHGAFLGNVSQTIFSNNRGYRLAGSLVDVYRSTGIVVNSNIVVDADQGGIWGYSDGSSLDNNVISNNEVSDSGLGIRLETAGSVEIRNNIISNNSIRDSGRGIQILSNASYQNLIEGNMIENIDDYGILLNVGSRDHNSIVNNIIFDCGNASLMILATSANKAVGVNISGNIIDTSTNYGIYAAFLLNSIISNNVISNVAYDGIAFAGVANSIIEGNTIKDVDTSDAGNKYGINMTTSSAVGSANNIVTNNSIMGIAHYPLYGIRTTASTDNGNTIKNNRISGLYGTAVRAIDIEEGSPPTYNSNFFDKTIILPKVEFDTAQTIPIYTAHNNAQLVTYSYTIIDACGTDASTVEIGIIGDPNLMETLGSCSASQAAGTVISSDTDFQSSSETALLTTGQTLILTLTGDTANTSSGQFTFSIAENVGD